ncbi:MAG: hypothetical protein AAFZ18_38095, partial [Myxococcota bacterium]
APRSVQRKYERPAQVVTPREGHDVPGSTTVRAREADLDLTAITEAVHVAAAIRGGASLVHGIQMLEQVREEEKS